MGKEITIDCTQGSISGYIAFPKEGEGKALLLVQEWWGIDTHMKALVDRFADEGFIVFAPDLYKGEVVSEPDRAERHMMQLNIDSAAKDLECAVEYIKSLPENKDTSVGVMGFCMGGQLALFAASKIDSIDACIDFYGIHPNVKPDFSAITCPVLGIFGGLDTFVPPDTVRELEGKLADAHVTHTFVTYEHAGHAFYNDSRKEFYHKPSAEDAHKKVLFFLKEHL